MLSIKFYGTYYFCNAIRNILYNQFSCLRDLDGFFCDDQVFYLVSPFQKYSVLHHFIEFVVDGIFHEDNLEVDIQERIATYRNFRNIPVVLEDLKPLKLPIELAMDFYRIDHQSFQDFLCEQNKGLDMWDEDDVSDYFLELRLCDDYEKLLRQSVIEVFHVLFENRELLLHFNNMMAGALEGAIDGRMSEETRCLFTGAGKLKRKKMPKWVRRAVFFRDQGRCVLCDKDLSGSLSIDNIENFDHIVPLAQFGFNDISNIQLLCKGCNQLEKNDKQILTSNKYHSWFSYDKGKQ